MAQTEVDRAGDNILLEQLCLEFINTVDWHASTEPEEGLTSYEVLVSWSKDAGIINKLEAKRLLQAAKERSAEGKKVLQYAITLREAIYRIFSAVAHGLKPHNADLETLNVALSEAYSRLRIVSTDRGFAWAWVGANGDLGMMLWPIVRSAAELLTSQELIRVKECANDEEGCGWLFLDMSKNQIRRWCSMRSCGNRIKVRRFYERERSVRKLGELGS